MGRTLAAGEHAYIRNRMVLGMINAKGGGCSGDREDVRT